MSSNETTTEYRLGLSRVEQKHGPHVDYRSFLTLEAAVAAGYAQVEIDREGVDGVPVGNPLTVRPFIERREVSKWERTAFMEGEDWVDVG